MTYGWELSSPNDGPSPAEVTGATPMARIHIEEVIDMENIWMLVIALVAAVGAFFAGSRSQKKDSGSIVRQAEELAAKVIGDARREADTITKEAELKTRAEAIEAKAGHDREMTEKKKDLQALEKRLQQKEENLDKKVVFFDQKELDILKKEQVLATKEQNLTVRDEELKKAA